MQTLCAPAFVSRLDRPDPRFVRPGHKPILGAHPVFVTAWRIRMNRSGVTRAIAATNRSRLGWSYAISSSSRLSTTKTAPLSLAAVDEDVSPQTSSPARFEATRWSVVLASAKTQAPGAKEALAELCRTYWQPLYAFARRRGHDHHRAQDMIQSFFLSLIESKSLARADPLKGKFRSYLLAALQNHMLSELSRSNAQKRGGGVQLISIDENDVESKFAAAHLSNQAPAEDVFEREWAVAAVEAAMSQLEAEFVRRRKQSIFLALKPYLIGEQPAGTYEQTSLALGQSVGAVRTGVHRLRQDFRTHLRREVAKTVESPDQIDEEMRHLRTVLGGSRT